MPNGRLIRTTTSALPPETISTASATSVRARAFFRSRHRVFQVEDDCIGAAPDGAVDKPALRHRHEQH
jgi:hypothetical protein